MLLGEGDRFLDGFSGAIEREIDCISNRLFNLAALAEVIEGLEASVDGARYLS
jgi:hypothetical protein